MRSISLSKKSACSRSIANFFRLLAISCLLQKNLPLPLFFKERGFHRFRTIPLWQSGDTGGFAFVSPAPSVVLQRRQIAFRQPQFTRFQQSPHNFSAARFRHAVAKFNRSRCDGGSETRAR